MTKTISFEELRELKDSLPDGTMARIADEFNLSVETVRNYFGGSNFKEGSPAGVHFEPGPRGGIVVIDDTTILDRALEILEEHKQKRQEA